MKVLESFVNGDYARWIKEFQRKNPKTISFSNKLSTLNKLNIKITSLNPVKIEAKDISSNDFENLGWLIDYFDYLKHTYCNKDTTSIIISVDGILYKLVEENNSGERVIMVVDIDDNLNAKPILEI